jgi:cytochrome bd-type quinol oxidase subunit 1
LRERLRASSIGLEYLWPDLTGGVLGQPLVVEGVFWFFLESAFLGLFLFAEKLD